MHTPSFWLHLSFYEQFVLPFKFGSVPSPTKRREGNLCAVSRYPSFQRFNIFPHIDHKLMWGLCEQSTPPVFYDSNHSLTNGNRIISSSMPAWQNWCILGMLFWHQASWYPPGFQSQCQSLAHLCKFGTLSTEMSPLPPSALRTLFIFLLKAEEKILLYPVKLHKWAYLSQYWSTIALSLPRFLAHLVLKAKSG